jgi:hypothetical protein
MAPAPGALRDTPAGPESRRAAPSLDNVLLTAFGDEPGLWLVALDWSALRSTTVPDCALTAAGVYNHSRDTSETPIGALASKSLKLLARPTGIEPVFPP